MASKITASVDTGTITVDSFSDAHSEGAEWQYSISDGTNMRRGIIEAHWDKNASSNPAYTHRRVQDIGTVTGISFSMDKNVNTVRLRCTSTSDGLTFKANRELVGS